MRFRAAALTAIAYLLALPTVLGKPSTFPYDQLASQRSFLSPPATKSLSIQAMLSGKKVYAGQPFTVSYRLYFQVPIIDPQNDINLKFKNCWVEEYPPVFTKKTAASFGEGATSVELKKYLLIPQFPGPLLIPALTQHYRVTSPPDPNSFFEEEKIVSTTVRSDPKSVVVAALPKSLDSLSFSNAVGRFKFHPSYTVSKKVDNLLTFTLTIDGPGNLKNVRLAPPALPSGIEAFNVEGRERHVLSDSTLLATYVFSYNLVAPQRGTYVLPGLRVKYFDPSLDRYVVYAVSDYAWRVTNAQLSQATAPTLPRPTRGAKHGLYTKSRLDQDRDLFVGSPLFNLLAGLLAGAGFAAVAYYRYREHQAAHAPFYRAQNARKKALRALLNNERQHFPHGLDAFTKGLHDVLITYLSHRLQAPEKIGSTAHLSRYLRDTPVPAPLREHTLDTLCALERLQFFLPPPAAANTQTLGSVVRELINQFEHHCHATSREKYAFRRRQLAAMFLPGKK